MSSVQETSFVAAMEEALAASFSAKALDGITIPHADLMTDMHFSAEYRCAGTAGARRHRRAMLCIDALTQPTWKALYWP